jgi:predicted DNA-binding protein
MSTNRITVRIGGKLRRRLAAASVRLEKKESELVREALEHHLPETAREETCYAVARRLGIIGSVKRAPEDLSTNRKYFKGFGRN